MRDDRRGASSGRSASALVLALLAASLLVGLLVQPVLRDGETVLTFLGIPLPAVCWTRAATGLPCASCGLTRSVVLLIHGQLGASVSAHPLGGLVVLLSLLQVPPRLARLAGSQRRWVARWDRLWLIALGAAGLLAMVWWVGRVGVRGWLEVLAR